MMKKFRKILKYFSTDFQSTIHTNDWKGYDGLVGLGYEKHHRIQHGTNEFVNSKSHFNGIENFWSLLKRAIRGTYVSVEPFHLFRYVDEEASRHNARQTTDASRFNSVLANVTGKRLTNNQLTGSVTPA